MPRCVFWENSKTGDTDTQHRNTGGGKTESRALKGKVYQFWVLDFDTFYDQPR